MQYVSTRNLKEKFSFKEVFLNSLASDGGLYVPKKIPTYSSKDLDYLKRLSYIELAVKIISNFCSDEFEEKTLNKILNKSYKNFRAKDVVILKNFDDIHLLELFHGPTLAFKDIAMQVMGNMYEEILKKEKKNLNIIVATSGDTGSAAISAIKGRSNINIFVLHPFNKISEIQRRLMTTVKENNVFNIAVEGNFDDCQNLVKSMFTDHSFKKKINMSGVNSINWARIIVQIVYYFYAYFKVVDENEIINFSVPTGNFGDVYAGYVSKKMGLPINKLIVATNQNDILKRVIASGEYKIKKVIKTISPSMDIQIASNFERLVFDIYNQNYIKVQEKMKKLKEKKEFKIDEDHLSKIKKDFLSDSLSEKETKNSIKDFYRKFKIILDPHTAVAYGVLKKIFHKNKSVVLATAHPCKFPDVINQAIGITPNLPSELKYIMKEEENFEIIPNNLQKVKQAIIEKI